jgi:hypothetical protein
MIEDPIKKPFPHNIIRPEKQEFTQWYERFFLQSPRLASLQYDDEKMWEAWKAGQKALGQMLKDNAELGKQNDCV